MRQRGRMRRRRVIDLAKSSPLTDIPSQLPSEFVAFRAAGEERTACLSSHSPADSHSLRNMSLLVGRSRGFVNYWRSASVVWRGVEGLGPFSPSKKLHQALCRMDVYFKAANFPTGPIGAKRFLNRFTDT